jgi:hypothetical protein
VVIREKIRVKERDQTPEAKERRRIYSQSPEGKEVRRKRDRERRAQDLNYRLGKNIKGRVNMAIKLWGKAQQKLCKKGAHPIRDLGHSVSGFVGYIKDKFWPGMSWAKWGNGPGKWNLDHIIPLAAFDLTDKEQCLRAFHYTNYQPLWWEDNNRKKAFVPTVLAQPVPFCGMMLVVALDENNRAVVRCFK